MRREVGTAMMFGTTLGGGAVRLASGKGDLHQAASQIREPTNVRGTSAGHSAPSGQLSENQAMTASYFRAVKVVPLSNLSKKRQSPAERRETVTVSRPRASAYAEAQVVR